MDLREAVYHRKKCKTSTWEQVLPLLMSKPAFLSAVLWMTRLGAESP
jgi:hypothetical protein